MKTKSKSMNESSVDALGFTTETSKKMNEISPHETRKKMRKKFQRA